MTIELHLNPVADAHRRIERIRGSSSDSLNSRRGAAMLEVKEPTMTTRAIQLILCLVTPPAWSPDGRWLAFRAGNVYDSG